MRILKMMFDFLITPICPICEKRYSNGMCCDECFIEINRDFNDNEIIKSLGVVKALAIFHYSDRVRKLIHCFKYDGFRNIGKFFVELLANKIEMRKDLFRENAVIVPIPTNSAKIRERGFDHTHFLANELSKLTNLEYKKLLFRINYNISQTKTKDRWENVDRAFIGINLEEYKNRQIILIDDVITTGSTMISAIKILDNLGYKNIICLSIAFKF